MIAGALKYRRSTLGLGDDRVDYNDPRSPRPSGTVPVFEGAFWRGLAQRAWEFEYEKRRQDGLVEDDEALARAADTTYNRIIAAQAWHRSSARSRGTTWDSSLWPDDREEEIIKDIAMGGPASSSMLNVFRLFSRPPDPDRLPPPGQKINIPNTLSIGEGSRLNEPSSTTIDLDAPPGDFLDEIKKWLQIIGVVLAGVVALYVVDKALPVDD